VLGEIAAGLLLGPTVLGTLAPEWMAWLFPESGPNAVLLEGLSTLGVALFLMVAGMEMDPSTVWQPGRIALTVGPAGHVASFAVAWLAPQALGRESDTSALIFALFFATALSISSLPVIAKTLMDLNLYRSDFGMVIISAAIYNDLLGWIIFAIILGMMGDQSG